MLQKAFNGGIDAFSDTTAVEDDAYVWGINTRARDTKLSAIEAPLQLTGDDVPVGKYQGLYSFGSLLVLFCSGKAYYKLPESGSVWTCIQEFQLDPTVDVIYACIVPGSNDSYKRQLDSTAGDVSQVKKSYLSTTLQAPSCAVIQDGVNQPWLIFSTGEARIAGTYDDWTTTNREYVPIGKQMVYSSNILFIVSSDGQQIYRSVSGRPLDFVVNVDTNGDKGGDASTTSLAVDYNAITCLMPVNATDTFYVSTGVGSYLLTLDYTNTLFGEPRATQQPVTNSGAINQFAFAEVLGDYVFIDYEGIKSSNATQQLKFRGKNSKFSLLISGLLYKKTQSGAKVCSGRFDNYSLFRLDTIFGPGIIVYDELLAEFVSLDINQASNVKQFCTLFTTDNQYLYVITHDNKLFQYYGDVDNYCEACVRTKSWLCRMTDNSTAAAIEQNINRHKSAKIRLAFDGVVEGNLRLMEEVDGERSGPVLPKDISVITRGIRVDSFPVMLDSKTISDVTFVVPGNKAGFKIGHIITWTGGGALHSFEVISNIDTSFASK